MQHETFRYNSLGDIQEKMNSLGVSFPMSSDVGSLFKPLQLGHVQAANRIAFQPMEGTDGTLGGAPDELTCRRDLRFAKGGPGLIWYEAVATVPEGRASAHQLSVHKDNIDTTKKLLDEIREISIRENGYAPVIIMQATSSGRYSKPQ